MEKDLRKVLLRTARESINSAFSGKVCRYPEVDRENHGAFVTLRKGGDLRGCIGYLAGIGTLSSMIAELARSAAFTDPRFPPLEPDELDECTIEISLLTEPEMIESLDDFVLSRDGIYMILGQRRAVFLPQVADETGWTKEEMLSALAMKAGLMEDAWKDPDAEFLTFQAEVFDESIL